jgi:LAS superfamily LD-carboxypeptidase LdcB
MRRVKRLPLLILWTITLALAGWVFLWPHPTETVGIQRRLVVSGYSASERMAIRTTLAPADALELSVNPYRDDALAYYGNPIYRILFDHGYAGTDLIELATLDRQTALNLTRFDVVASPQRFVTDPYFLWTRFERAVALLTRYPNASGRSIVERVNTNRDLDYYSVIHPALGEGLSILVNKYHALPSTYVPTDLTQASGCGQPILAKAAADAYDQLCLAVKAQGLKLGSSSAFRTYARQKELYDYYISIDGLEVTDRDTARPGHSEHQTGLAVDFNAGDGYYGFFIKSDTYAWVRVNSWRYGFILRFPEDKTDITGYIFEPWHYRYVGVETATLLHNLGITYDEYAIWIAESGLIP